MARLHPIVFLIDVDNTLLDNDGIQQDLKDHLRHSYGDAGLHWSLEAGIDWIQHAVDADPEDIQIFLKKDLPLSATILDMREDEAKSNEHVEIGCKSPVLLDYACGEPISRARTLIQVSVNRTSPATGASRAPMRPRRSRANRPANRGGRGGLPGPA